MGSTQGKPKQSMEVSLSREDRDKSLERLTQLGVYGKIPERRE